MLQEESLAEEKLRMQSRCRVRRAKLRAWGRGWNVALR